MKRLYTRIYLHFLGVLLVVGIATTLVFASGWRREFHRNLIQRFTHHAATMLASHFEEPGRSETLVRLHEELGIDFTIRDPDGAVIASATAGDDSPLPGPTGKDARDAHKGFCMYGAGRRMCSAAPILAPETSAVLGILIASPPHRFGAPNLVRPALSVGLVLLIVGIAAAPLARRISRPIERLAEATRRFGGGELSYRIRPSVRCEKDGEVVANYGVHRHDELGNLMRAWNEMADRIETLVKGHKELLANVSHELRSPLARIRVALELLPPGARDETRLKDVEQDLVELDRLIETILTTSRLEANAMPIERSDVDVPLLLAQIADRAAHDPAVTGKTVIVEPGPPLTFHADGALLKRALWNLVENAAKYGAPPIRIAGRRAENPGAIVFTVSDEGPGIDAPNREKVFTPFFRADIARTPSAAGEPSQGFGLGLTLARRIAEAHGGTIAAEPARREGDRELGCRISIRIPIG